MRNNNDKGHRDKMGRAATHPVAPSPTYTAEEREMVRRGLRVLAKIIARAHLRRQAERGSTAAPGPRPARRRQASTVSEQSPKPAAPSDNREPGLVPGVA